MNVYTGIHSYYCGIDLHARTMYVCILDKDGKKVYHKNIHCRPDRFLQAIEPYRAISLLAWSAFSAGTGWPTCAKRKGSTLYWATPSI